MTRRVVVTGLGVVTCLGVTPQSLWAGILQGRSGATTVTSFDCSEFERTVACPVTESIGEGQPNPGIHQGRATLLGIMAAQQAIADAGINVCATPHIPLCVGTTMGESHSGVSAGNLDLRVDGRLLPSMSIQQMGCNAIARGISARLGLNGETITIPTACAAGNYAIGYGADLIRRGESSLVLAGASDALSRIAFMGFARLKVLSPDLCRPFDKNRKGLLVGEGSAFVVLEDWKRAMARGASPYAEFLGYGLSCDGHHITSPHPDGIGAALAIQRGLSDANVGIDEVDYISAHGTGTQANDRMETLAVKRVFASNAKRIPISSIKSLIGHAMGAASAIEAVVCCLILRNQVLPPTWNYQEPDPDCDLDYVPNEPRVSPGTDVVVSNSFAFGGNNACIVLKRV